MGQHSYLSASNSLLARTADRTPKTFALQGDPSRPTFPPSSKRSPYIISPAGHDVTWNDVVHSSVSPLLIEISRRDRRQSHQICRQGQGSRRGCCR
ncbi:hypothetical protein AVEN_4333-1 [Araneus ventricosus]|uniref:Uncharacterized protein n=1 Tax=Araneus ventricosus TaxID=182803 RepID=A0A4Y2KY53_ARAVE|nr:hypothetical protein AVEN_4333-1 [Araneus ventricosus]